MLRARVDSATFHGYLLQGLLNESSTEASSHSAGASVSVDVVAAAPATESRSSQEQPGQKEVVYTPASEALLVARKELSGFSFSRAQHRIDAANKRRDNEQLMSDETHSVRELYIHSKDLALNSSQFGDERPLTAIRYSADGNLIATGSLSSVVKIWDTQVFLNAGVLRNAVERITALSWHPESGLGARTSLLAAASADGTCYVWNTSLCSASGGGGGSENCHHDKNGDAVSGNSSSAKDDEIAPMDLENAPPPSAAGGNGLNPSQQAIMHKLEGHRGVATACEFHPMGSLLGTAGADRTWRLWDVATGTELLVQDGHYGESSALAFHPDGSLACSTDSIGVALVWDLRSGQCIQSLTGHTKKITGVSFHANGFQFVTSGADNLAKIWDLRKKKCHYTLPAHGNIITDAKYSSSGELLVTSSFDGAVKVWGSRDFRILRTLTGDGGKLMACDVAPDERHIVSAGYDRTIKLYAHKDEF